MTDQILKTYQANAGNISATARELGIHRDTVRKHLTKLGALDKPLAGGRTSYIDLTELPLPEAGTVKRYILTSAQNNTKVYTPFLRNLEAYAQWLDAELMIARYTYNKSSYANAKSHKPGRGPTADDKAELWFDSAIEPYTCDNKSDGDAHYLLAPDLVWCAQVQILPTAARPLSDMLTYMGTRSIILPHAKLAMASVPTSREEMPKFAYTTGTVTSRNYIKKKAGFKAEFHHAYCALIVEVADNGSWWVRQLNANNNGAFYDIPEGPRLAVKVGGGEVYDGFNVEAVNWGDVHASEIDPAIARMNWDEGGIVDALRPKYQFMHDVLSFRSQSHHDRHFGKRLQKFVVGVSSVEEEIETTTDLLERAERDFTQTVVVNSNHDRHFERWLDETDFRDDLENCEFYLLAQLERVRAIKQGRVWDGLEWALTLRERLRKVCFLARDESFTICGDIECGWHGDDGPNGSRGTTRSLVNVGRRVNKGHDHSAAILDGVYSAGACAMSYEYQTGPSAQSVSHIITYPNGKRAIITVRDGKWRG